MNRRVRIVGYTFFMFMLVLQLTVHAKPATNSILVEGVVTGIGSGLQPEHYVYYNSATGSVVYEYNGGLGGFKSGVVSYVSFDALGGLFLDYEEEGVKERVWFNTTTHYQDTTSKFLRQAATPDSKAMLLRVLVAGNTYKNGQWHAPKDVDGVNGRQVAFSNTKVGNREDQYGLFVALNQTKSSVTYYGKGPQGDIKEDLTTVIENMLNDPADYSTYEGLEDIFTRLKVIYEDIDEQIKDNIIEEADKVVGIEIANFDSRTELDKWSTVVKNHLITGDPIANQPDYTVESFPSSLTNTEIILIKNYSRILSNFYDTDYSLPDTFKVTEEIAILNPTEIDGYNIPSTEGIPKEEALTEATKVSTKAKALLEFQSVVSEPKYVAVYFDDLVRYSLPYVYGFEYKNQVTNESENVGFVTINDKLEVMLPSVERVSGSPISMLDSIPIFSGVREINNMDKLADLYLAVFYADSFISQTLELQEDGTYLNPELDLIEDNVEDNTEALSQIQKDTLVAYKSYIAGLEYLGVAPESLTHTMVAAKEYLNKYGHLVKDVTLEDSIINDLEPLSMFVNLEQGLLSKYYMEGVALSATFMPLRTNVYDAHTYAYIEDKKFIDDFHYPYGFHRKALYISTDEDAATNLYVSGVDKSTRKIATLKDILQPNRDVVLYLDDNFYNIKTLADIQGQSYDMSENTDEGEDNRGLWDKLSDVADIKVQNIVKTGPDSIYSEKVASKTADYTSAGTSKNKYENAILSVELIDEYLADVEYSEMQSFALVSAIYRDKKLFNIIQDQAISGSPVFISSPNVAGVPGIDENSFMTLYNYTLIANITDIIGIDVDTSLDLESPVFMDIYGNILTASGLVVIPATSNATLHKPETFNLYNAAFLTSYGRTYNIELEYNNTEERLEKFFRQDEDNGIWILQDKEVNGLYLDFGNLPYSDKAVMNTLRLLYEQDVVTQLDINQRINLITEVMRGAPLENIDLEHEGIIQSREVSDMGVYTASKLDILANDVLANLIQNTLVSFPNLAHIKGVEYIVLFVFKAVFIILFLVLFVQVYVDAVKRELGFKTIGKFIMTVVLITGSFWVFPKLMEYSYYIPNKVLLQDTMKYLMILDVEKKAEGREIGITEVTEPQSDTDLYIRLDSVGVSWAELIDKVLFAEVFTTVEDAYKEAYENNLMSNQEGVEIKSDGLYMSVDTIMESSSVEFNLSQEFIYQKVFKEPTASFAIPYYVILDNLIGTTNKYNKDNKIKSYETRIMDKGKVATIGLIEPYLTSKEFMEINPDLLSMGVIYDMDKVFEFGNMFSEEDIQQIRDSRWFTGAYYEKEDIAIKLDKLNQSARKFISNNRDLLGKITDETFLKCMAFQLSLEHNKIFNAPSTTSIEIFGLDNRDLIRLTLAKPSKVLELAATSFGRFVYELGGTLLVFPVAALTVIYAVGAIVKPILSVILIVAVLFSVFWHKLVLRQENRSIQGYLISFGAICLINLAYALVLGLSLYVPRIGISPLVASFIQILLQIAYLVALWKIATFIIMDIYNVGFTKYAQIMSDKFSANINTAKIYVQRATVSNERVAEDYSGLSDYNGISGEEYLRRMYEREDERRKSRWKRKRKE